MRLSRLSTIAVIGVIVLGGASCSTVDEAVEGAQNAVEDVVDNVQYCAAAIQVADAVNNENWDRAISAGEDLVANAPDEIRPEAQTVLDGAREIRDGNRARAADPEFRQAAEQVEQFTRDHCDPTS